MGIKASPENIEFRRIVASYGDTAPMKIARELGCDVSKIYDAKNANTRNNSAQMHHPTMDRCPFNSKLLLKFRDNDNLQLLDGRRRLRWKGRVIGIEGLAKIAGLIPSVPNYE